VATLSAQTIFTAAKRAMRGRNAGDRVFTNAPTQCIIDLTYSAQSARSSFTGSFERHLEDYGSQSTTIIA
jgi:hypothetical protein